MFMASPKNWSRRDFVERKKIPYAWKNRNSGQHIMVIGTTGHYEVRTTPEHVNNFSLENLSRESIRQKVDGKTRWDNKEEARSAAVEWMEDHPMEQRNSSSTSHSRQY